MKSQLTTYSDGATIRLHNKRISFKKVDGKTMISFQFVDKEADKPACGHKCIKGKVRDTFVQMSDEAMDALVFVYLKHKKDSVLANQNPDEPKETNNS